MKTAAYYRSGSQKLRGLTKTESLEELRVLEDFARDFETFAIWIDGEKRRSGERAYFVLAGAITVGLVGIALGLIMQKPGALTPNEQRLVKACNAPYQGESDGRLIEIETRLEHAEQVCLNSARGPSVEKRISVSAR